MFDDFDDNEKQLLEMCAQIATWQFMESDPVEKERLGNELDKHLKAAADARAERVAGMGKENTEKEASTEKAAQAEKNAEQPEVEEKATATAELESDRDQVQPEPEPERVRDYVLEIPDYIKNSAAYQQVLEDQRTVQYERISEQSDPYERAAKALEAEPLEQGQEIEGELLEVAQVNGKNYYVIEQDGQRFAVPAGDEPEFEKGDEIAVSRTKEGFEAAESYGYGL